MVKNRCLLTYVAIVFKFNMDICVRPFNISPRLWPLLSLRFAHSLCCGLESNEEIAFLIQTLEMKITAVFRKQPGTIIKKNIIRRITLRALTRMQPEGLWNSATIIGKHEKKTLPKSYIYIYTYVRKI